MTTQGTSYSESITPPARKSSSDSHPGSESGEGLTTDIRNRLRSAVETGKARVGEWRGSFEDGVRERPIQSVLIATAIGAALGMLIGRRGR